MEKINNNTYININSIQSLQIINDKYYAILTSGSKMEITKDQFDKLNMSSVSQDELSELLNAKQNKLINNTENIDVATLTAKKMGLRYTEPDGTQSTGKWNSNLVPDTSEKYDLGSQANNFKRVFARDGMFDKLKMKVTKDGITSYNEFARLDGYGVKIKNPYTTNTIIDSDDDNLDIYHRQKINIIPDCNSPDDNITQTNYDRIKIGGVEIVRAADVETNTITPIIMTYKKASSGGDLVPFAITKDGLVYYQGYEVVNKNTIGNLTDLTTTTKNNLVGAINEVNTISKTNTNNINKLGLSLADLKEALYGYVLDTTSVEIENTIPTTVTISDTTYNLVDNVRGLVKNVNGNTAKSENLLLLEDKAETTINGITYGIKNGVITISGTATQDITIYLNVNIPSGTYSFSSFSNKNIQFRKSGVYIGGWVSFGEKTFDDGIDQISIYYSNGTTATDNIIKPMLIKGSTAPSEFKQGFEGLKSVEYEGIKITNLQGVSNTILPFNTTLRGVGTAKDKIVISKNSDNEYYTAIKVSNIGVVDLEKLNWENKTDSDRNRYLTTISNIKKVNANIVPNCISTNYAICDNTSGWDNNISDTAFISANSKTFVVISATSPSGNLVYELETPTQEVLSTNLTESQVMPLLELGGSIEIINSNSDFVNGTTTIEMVYKLIN